MATPFEDWPAVLGWIRTESDVIVSFDGIPAIMSNDEFLRTYGDIESPEYLAMLDSIESRIENLALNRK
jgi:hypothetical protein